jgi:hypothetical protein
MGCGLTPASVSSADNIDPEADKIRRSMSTYPGGLSAFSVNAAIPIPPAPTIRNNSFCRSFNCVMFISLLG